MKLRDIRELPSRSLRPPRLRRLSRSLHSPVRLLRLNNLIGMNFRDVPNLLKFEHHARAHSDNEIVMDCYKRIRDLIAPVPKPPSALESGLVPMDSLKAGCEAVEKSTRLLWACAAATDQISPRPWNYLPDYQSSLEYFLALNDLELMAITKPHRILWEEAAEV